MGDGRDPIPIGKLLEGQSRRLGMGGARHVGALFGSWARIVGPSLAAHVEPISLRAGVLRVRADSPAWATEIGYLRDEIRGHVNEALGGAVVERIEVRAGSKRSERRSRVGEEPASDVPPGGEGSSGGSPALDPLTAFERARAAWLRRRRKTR